MTHCHTCKLPVVVTPQIAATKAGYCGFYCQIAHKHGERKAQQMLVRL